MASPLRATRLIAALALCALTLNACGGADARRTSHMARGQKYLAAGNLQKAQIEFRNVMQIAPRNVEARLMSARVAERLGNVREAAGLYQSAIDLDPDSQAARAALGRLYVFAKIPDRALDLVRPALLQHPDDPELLTVRGAARSELHDHDAALADAQRAVQLAPRSENAVALLASLYEQNGQGDRALELMRATLAQLPASVDLRLILANLYARSAHLDLAEQQLREIVRLQPADRDAYYRLAAFYARLKRVDDAERTFRQAIALAPRESEPKLRLVQFLTEARSPAAAERALNEYLAQDRSNLDLRLALGTVQQQQGHLDQALATYRAVGSDAGTHPQGLIARDRAAAVLVAQRQLDQAASMLAEVLTRNPRDGDALLLRAGIALERGEAAGAISDLRAVLRDRPRSTQVMQMLGRAHLANGEPALAEEQLRAAVEASPGEPELVLALAQVQIQQGKGDAAVASLQDAARAFPKNLPIRESLVRAQLDRPDLPAARRDAEAIERDNPGRALGPYLEGLVAQADHRPAEAEAKLEQALTLQPDAVDVLGALARLHASQGHLPRAIERIGRFTQAQPNNAGGLNLLAELYLAAADYPSAIEQLTRTIRVAPRWSVPYRNLALAQLRSGNPPAAELAYRQGIASAGEDPPLVSGLASLYEERGRPEDAIGLYESLHRRQPRLALAANNLAMLLVTYRKDAASLDRARDLTAPFANSPNASLLDTVGWVRFKRGELALALPVLERAAVRAPQSPVIQYHLGMAELRTGDRERARVSLQSAVHTEQHFVGLDEARTALAQIVSKRG